MSDPTRSLALSLAPLAVCAALSGCAAPADEAADLDAPTSATTEAFSFLDGDLKVVLVSKVPIVTPVGTGLLATLKISNVGGLDTYPGHASVLCARTKIDKTENVGEYVYDGGFEVPVLAPGFAITRTISCSAKPGYKTDWMAIAVTPGDATPKNNKLTVYAP